VTAAEKVAEPLPLSIPAVAHEFWFACGCLESDCVRAGFQADALPYVDGGWPGNSWPATT
jgi:hypothetical protein